MASRGRPVESIVHNYFTKIDGNKATCQVKKETGQICGVVVKSANFATNLKAHLNKCHLDVADEVRKADKRREESAKSSSKKINISSTGNQKTLADCFNRQKPYEESSLENSKRNEALALFLGGTNVPISTVENSLFRNLVAVLDHRYVVPGRFKATKMVANLRTKLNARITQLLLESNRITLTTDLWTKKDLTPFMGVTAHFYNRKDHKRYNIVLALKVLPHPHTGNNIYDKLIEILAEWNVTVDKISKVITDNASNMVKAFGTTPEENLDEISVDDESMDESDNEVTESVTLDECKKEAEESDYSDNETYGHDEGDHFLNSFGLEDSFLEEDEIEFDRVQEEQQTLWDKKHLRCIVHSLQLVVRKFEEDITMKSSLKSAIGLVKKFRKSSKLAEKLKRSTNGKSLRVHCATRWMSLFRMIERLLELRNEVAAICSDKRNKIDDLRHSQWKQLEQMRELLEPFADHTLDLESYNSTSLSLVLPALCNLEKHLKKVTICCWLQCKPQYTL